MRDSFFFSAIFFLPLYKGSKKYVTFVHGQTCEYSARILLKEFTINQKRQSQEGVRVLLKVVWGIPGVFAPPRASGLFLPGWSTEGKREGNSSVKVKSPPSKGGLIF